MLGRTTRSYLQGYGENSASSLSLSNAAIVRVITIYRIKLGPLSHARVFAKSAFFPLLASFHQQSTGMAEAYASGRQSGSNRSMSPFDDDIPSTTVQEGDLSCESEHLVLPHSRHSGTDSMFTTALLRDGGQASLTRGDRTLHYWCYGLHTFLVVIHTALVAMLFTHPEHRFSVSIDNTTATIVLQVFLQAFYSVRLRELVPWILT